MPQSSRTIVTFCDSWVQRAISDVVAACDTSDTNIAMTTKKNLFINSFISYQKFRTNHNRRKNGLICGRVRHPVRLQWELASATAFYRRSRHRRDHSFEIGNGERILKTVSFSPDATSCRAAGCRPASSTAR